MKVIINDVDYSVRNLEDFLVTHRALMANFALEWRNSIIEDAKEDAIREALEGTDYDSIADMEETIEEMKCVFADIYYMADEHR